MPKILKFGNYFLSHEHKEEIQVIFHKYMDLLINSILNNNNNNNNNNSKNNNNNRFEHTVQK